MATNPGTKRPATATKSTTNQENPPAIDDLAQNLRLLKAILEAPADLNSISSQPRRPKTPLAVASRQNGKTTRNTRPANKDGKSNIIDAKEESTAKPPASVTEQKKLAMTCFNQNLKILSTFVKKRQANRLRKPDEGHARSPSSNQDEEQKCLKVLEEVQEDVSKSAECACAALAVLRLHDHQEASSEDASYKREQGAILLLDKMITLDLEHLAHIEASRIHEQYWKRRKNGSVSKDPKRATKKIDLAILLCEGRDMQDKKDFDLTTSFQSQLLRLALLTGPSVVDGNFVHAVKAKTRGSSVDVILSAQKGGFVTGKIAGESLRIISQALSKISAALAKPAQDASTGKDMLALDLLAEAQTIKLVSWQLTKYEPDLVQELWTPVEKGVKMLWSKRQQADSNRYTFTRAVLERLQVALRDYSLPSELPGRLQVLLYHLAESNGDDTTAIAWLEQMLSVTTGIKKLPYACQLSALLLKTRPVQDDTVKSIEEVTKLLNDSLAHETTLKADDLVAIVRLRKMCFEKLSSPIVKEPSEIQQAVQIASLRILLTTLRFCHFFCCKEKLDKKLQRSLRMATLKTIENLVDSEKSATSAQPRVFFEYLDNLKECIQIVSESSDLNAYTTDEFEPSVFDALKIRISNVFWRSHLHSSVTDSSEITAIKLAQISVDCLSKVSIEELRKAALGPRLEKLSSMYAQDEEIATARDRIEAAIKHYILTDALCDAVEASLSKRSGDVWVDAASLASQLARALHSYNNLSLEKLQSFVAKKCIYDNMELTPIHRAVLLEHQVLYFLKKHSELSIYRSLQEVVQTIVELVNTCQYRVWMARFVSAVVFRASKMGNLSINDVSQLVELVDTASRSGAIDANAFLKPYHTVLEVQLKLQRALLAEPCVQNDLRDDLERLLEKVSACSKLKNFDGFVDDSASFQSILHAYTDQVFALHDYEAAILCLKIRICMEDWFEPSNGTLTDCYIKLAISHVRLDNTESAKHFLEKADKTMRTANGDSVQAIHFHLASAEYHLATSALADCKSSLRQAGSAFAKSWTQEVALSSIKQIERDSMVAKGAMLASALAVRNGDLLLANRYARQATKISVSIWSVLEKRISSTEAIANDDTTMASLTENMSKLGIEPDKGLTTFRTVGPRYWPHLDMYIRSLKQLALILSDSGLCEDALHYFKQLMKISSSMPSSNLLLNPAPALSLLFAKAGRSQEALQTIVDNTPHFDSGRTRSGLADAVLSCCEAYVSQGNLLQASALLSRIPMQVPDRVVEELKPDSSVKISKPVSKARRGVAKSEVMKGFPKRQGGSSKPKVKSAAAETPPPRKTSHLSFDQIVNESRRRAIVLACQKERETTANKARDATNVSSFSELSVNLVQELHEEAKCMLAEAWTRLSADAFASVLTESAMALPSRTKPHHRTARVSLIQSGGEDVDMNSTTQSRSSGSSFSEMQTTAHTLQTALTICKFLLEDRPQYCPVDMIHSLVKMEARISLLLTSMNLPFVISSTDLVLKASQPKDCALDRERIVSLAEQATQERSALSVWPCSSASPPTLSTSVMGKQLSDLPASWSVVSLALAEDNDELLLSKAVAGSEPFLVRIPLRRSNEGSSADEFVFEDAKNEMTEIIEAANSSSHDIRGTLDKATRAQWHADRELLDQKLASLLENIETIWLGGFRGILSPYAFEPKRIKQFGKTLAQSLDKNLPSRQKSSAVEDRVQIHEHILEIFLGLGNPDDNDLDDSVMDLLYFVVDILQFNGERNAYDEIDWDVILVDVLDALKAYHNSAGREEPRHTILILDKELEMFSWEALPCLINHPVSRMPSLGSVFERLTQMRTQSKSKDLSAYTIKKPSAHGTIILNPSGDLKSTQEFFEPILSDNLPSQNYTSLINTPPTESQFSSLLTKSDIFLYIGHGSGAQYIRPRTIRALPSCAVTFLFGCSSAKMTTHGSYESTGMPRAYMLGHAPAVVGCLWDVTDKEIDRVALQTLVSWGMIDGADKRVQEGLKKKGRRSKGKEKNGAGMDKKGGEGGKRKTLIEAVKDGKEACVLRYLCGAAVVVYGVPVVLE